MAKNDHGGETIDVQAMPWPGKECLIALRKTNRDTTTYFHLKHAKTKKAACRDAAKELRRLAKVLDGWANAEK